MLMLPPQVQTDDGVTVDLVQKDRPDGGTNVVLRVAGETIGTVSLDQDEADRADELVLAGAAIALPVWRRRETRRRRLLHAD